ncbi:MAG: HAMP domain-containing sensor histidine kinase [Parabacteroides sp.]|nr:HAMP domain-containing sensor histidine kinase [Parabacteroides sp.]
MEQRLKLINILTIIAAISIIFMQIYWLKTQYDFVVQESVKAKLTDLNDSANLIFSTDRSRDVNFDMIVRVIRKGDKKVWLTTISANESNVRNSTVYISKTNRLQIDTFYLEKPVQEYLCQNAITKYIANVKHFVSVASLEKALQKSMNDASITVKVCHDSSLVWEPKVLRRPTFLHPSYSLLYGFNPLVRSNVIITGKLAIQPILKEMLWQLVVSILWSALLIGCLIYQFRTITLQNRIERLRSDFLHTMIHELKRPVQALKMLISFLKDKEMRSDKQLFDEALDDSQTELDNLSAYFSKLRDMTYDELEEIPLNVTCFDLKSVAQNSIHQLRLPSERKLEIKLETDETPMLVKADKMHIGNIISNLLENAVKYSGGNSRIVLRIHCFTGRFLIEVEDNGFGISTDDQVHIFEKFYRCRSVQQRDIPGIGLGLSYVKMLVDAHKGSIFVSSHINEGAKFTINIPQEKSVC